jgi:hypothetical protein
MDPATIILMIDPATTILMMDPEILIIQRKTGMFTEIHEKIIQQKKGTNIKKSNL